MGESEWERIEKMSVEMNPESKLRLFSLRYEMSNGWLMLLAWMPYLPRFIAQWIANHYVRKTFRKFSRMSQEHIKEILKEMK